MDFFGSDGTFRVVMSKETHAKLVRPHTIPRIECSTCKRRCITTWERIDQGERRCRKCRRAKQ